MSTDNDREALRVICLFLAVGAIGMGVFRLTAWVLEAWNRWTGKGGEDERGKDQKEPPSSEQGPDKPGG